MPLQAIKINRALETEFLDCSKAFHELQNGYHDRIT